MILWRLALAVVWLHVAVALLPQEVNLSHYYATIDLQRSHLSLELQHNGTELQLQCHQRQVVQLSTAQLHGAVHVFVMDPTSGQLLTSRHLITGDPGQGDNLHELLKGLRSGRLLLLVGSGDFLRYLYPRGAAAVLALDSQLVGQLVNNEPWYQLATTRGNGVGRVLVEGTMTMPPPLMSDINRKLQPHLSVSVEIPKPGERVTNGFRRLTIPDPCWWEAGHPVQAGFCRRYSGYGRLCNCQRPYLPARHTKADVTEVTEVIPVVILTATRPWLLYRLLHHLMHLPEETHTPVLVVLDGARSESLHLMQLFPWVQLQVHQPQGNTGENTRTNTNVAFGLSAVFALFPEVDKAIVLEEDLIPSPDMLSYFHQLAPVLGRDSSLLAVNAFGEHSYPDTANNTSTIKRVEVMPQYGWMMTRAVAKDLLTRWVPVGRGRDWDWWLTLAGQQQGRHVLVPEISRVRHVGEAGAHMTAWEQSLYHDDRTYTTAHHHTLIGLDRLEKQNYARWYEAEIRRATMVVPQKHPCLEFILPPQQVGPFVIYLGLSSLADSLSSFFVFLACLGSDPSTMKETYEGTITLNVRRQASVSGSRLLSDSAHQHRVLYIVGCPRSRFCPYSNITNSEYLAPSPAMVELADSTAMLRRAQRYSSTNRIRVAANSTREEVSRENIMSLQLHRGVA